MIRELSLHIEYIIHVIYDILFDIQGNKLNDILQT